MAALTQLSNRELLDRLKTLVRKERTTTIDILRHLCEVEKRKLHLSLGHCSLFDYCIVALGYSNSAAGRRIAAARCVRDYPDLEALLAKNEVNLITVSMIAPVLRPENKNALIESIRGKSQRAVEGFVAQYRGPAAFRDRVRRVYVPVRTNESDKKSHSQCGSLTNVRHERSESRVEATMEDVSLGSSDNSRNESRNEGAVKPLSSSRKLQVESRLLIQFLASPAFMNKYEEVRSLLSNRSSCASFERIFEAALDSFIDKHSPRKRTERREQRKAKLAPQRHSKKDAKESGGQNDGLSAAKDTKNIGGPVAAKGQKDGGRSTQSNGRFITAAVRDAVHTRDGGRCTYLGKNGRRCGSRHGLHIDHIVPVARGGQGRASNLRLLCALHNQLEAVRLFGQDYMRRFTGEGVNRQATPRLP